MPDGKELKLQYRLDATVSNLMVSIRKKYKLKEGDALYVFVKTFRYNGNTEIMPTVSQTIGDLLDIYGNENILHIVLRTENTFGQATASAILHT